MTARKPAQMTAEERAAKVGALKPEWAKTYILQLEAITRHLAGQLQAAKAQGAADLNLAREISGARDRLADGQLHQHPEGTHSHPYTNPDHDTGNGQITEAVPSAWTPAGITPPNEDYTTARVVDGAANMSPVADLSASHEIRFADFYQVHYGSHETTGGVRLLVIEGDGPIIIHPIDQATVLISRGGHDQRA